MSEIIELINEASSEGIQREYEYKYILTEQIYKVLLNESFKEISISSNQKIKFTTKSKKTRPYIYFDTPNLDLLNKKAQFSVRKRENDYFITFKKPEYGFENPSLTGRVENNYKLTLAEGESIFASSTVTSIQNHEAVVKAGIFADIDGSLIKELCRFTVDTSRLSAFLDNQEICEIAIDKISLPNGISLFELEIEARNSKNKSEGFSSFDKITDKILDYFVEVIREYTNQDFDFIKNRIILPKFRRVLEHVQKSNFSDSSNILDWTNGANHLADIVKAQLAAESGNYFFIPSIISYYPHPDFKLQGKAGKEAFLEARSKIIKYASVYLQTLLNKMNKNNDGFHLWKILLPESEIMLLFQFKATGDLKQGERIIKLMENFLEKQTMSLLEIAGDKEFYNKIQLNFGIGNKNATIDGRGLSKTVRDVTFYNFSSEMPPELLDIHVEEIYSVAYKNLRNLEDKRYDLTKMNIKSPCCGITTNRKDTMYKLVLKKATLN